jgi:hypothetical protein
LEGSDSKMKNKICDRCNNTGSWTNCMDEIFICDCKKKKPSDKKYVWLVGVSNCEGNETVCICSNKKIAVRELFKKRNEMIAEWKEQDTWLKKQDRLSSCDYMYENMIKNLASDDYEKWDNYPHDVPYIHRMKVKTK